MLLDELSSDLLKKWIIKKLEDISDADSDVLADYVLALVKTDEPESVAKSNCIESLKDFVPNNTDSFVNELFRAITTKSYDPNTPPLKPTASIYQPLKRSNAEPPRLPNESRKRSRHDWDREESVNSNGAVLNYESEVRPLKQPKRGGRGHANRHPHSLRQTRGASQNTTLDYFVPFGMPSLDPNNPADAIRAMQQTMEMFASMRRCQEYYKKGFCTAGPSCPYEHEEPYIMPSQQYDPANATLTDIQPSRVGKVDMTKRERGSGRGRGRGRGTNNWRGGGKRADFSHVGPSRDLSTTEIVVEQIPDDKCNEQAVRDFFVRFGPVEEIRMHPQNKLAIVKFDTHEAAQSAYDSPKVIFDNRFVKIYWYKPAKHSEMLNGAQEPDSKSWRDVEMDGAEPTDEDEFAKRQEEAQRKHEELTKQRVEAERQKEEVTAKLLKMEAERKQVEVLLAKKSGNPEASSTDTRKATDTEALKAQLAQLEAHAKSLGIDPDAAVTNGFSNHPSYPGYRGRGTYRGRGRGAAHYRGYGGGWGSGLSGRGGAVMRLDNRPKTVAVTFANGSYDDHDEALRQFLLFNSLDSATITKHPERNDTALLAFTQRYEGENFMTATKSELPHVGKVELSWYKSGEQSTFTNGTHDQDDSKVIIPNDAPSSDLPDVEQAYDNGDEDLDRYS